MQSGSSRRAELEATILSDIQGSTNEYGRTLTQKELESVARVRARNIVEREAYRAGCSAAIERVQDMDCPNCGSGSWKARGIMTMGDNPETVYFVECAVCGWSERFGMPTKQDQEEKRGRKIDTYGT